MTMSAERPQARSGEAQRVPDFFIVGHAKCGTTALYEMLRRHPQVYMPDRKEPQYFSRDNPQPQITPERSVAFTGRRVTSPEEYLALFSAATPDQRLGEASTSYIWSRSAASRIADVRPDARIIAILREPASFLRSLHLQMLQNSVEVEKDFRKAVALEEARREGREIPENAYWPQALIYSDRVRYVEQLQRYHAAFTPEQVLVLIYDDFRRDNEATVRRVQRFLDIDDTVPLEVLGANPTIGVRSVGADKFVRRLRQGRGPLSGAVKASVKTLTPWRLRHHVLYPLRDRVIYGKPPPPDERFTSELRQRFRPEVVALSKYLDRDFLALWGYDRMG